MFIPPINLGHFQPSPSTIAEWVYQIWQYLQENPIATKEMLEEYIGTYITTSPETQAMIGEGVEEYLIEHPPAAPVQSVQGKTGAVVLSYPDIVPASNAVPVYRAATAPNTSTAQGLYNNGYRLFVNTTTQEIYTISNVGVLSMVGRGKIDATNIDMDSSQGDTTIAETITTLTPLLQWKEDTVDPAINDSVYSAGTTIVDSSVKMGYCQSKINSSTQSQLVFNIALPKEIANTVTGATINSGTSLVVRAGGSRIPSSGSAILGTTASWAFSSVVLNKELGIVRVTIDMPKSADAEQNAATLAGSISLTLN